MRRVLGGYFDFGKIFQVQPLLIRERGVLSTLIDYSLTHELTSLDFYRTRLIQVCTFIYDLPLFVQSVDITALVQLSDETRVDEVFRLARFSL